MQVAATRIQMVISVCLGEWALLVMLLHSGAVVRLRFTEHKNKSASDIVIH